jgi:hypothetical protein
MIRARSTTLALCIAAALMALACSAGGGPSPRSTGSSGSDNLSVPAMKLRVLKAVGGHLDYCDPDLYPVGFGTPLEAAERRLPSIRAAAGSFAAILAFEHIPAGSALTDAQKVAINEDYKQIEAIDLRPAGARFGFTVYVPTQAYPTYSRSFSGTVDRSGSVRLGSPGPGRSKMCPICLAQGTMIATPNGPVSVQSIRPGMAVWTTDRAGRRIEGHVLEAGWMVAFPGHTVVTVELANGLSVTASPGHPTGDGRTVGDLRVGDLLDGAVVVAATLRPYEGSATYDLLPSGPTGAYFANGVLLGSTLAETPGRASQSSNRCDTSDARCQVARYATVR